MRIERICARGECDIIFEPKAHNGIYCSEECRRVATNAKVLKRYHEKRENRSNKKRVCKNKNCATILSTYNKEDICEGCKTIRLKKRLRKWGWGDEEIEKRVEAL